MHPLDPALNRAILSLAPAHDVADRAPSTFLELAQCPRRIVWAGASDATIFGDPAINWAFRAWHDATHLALAADFTLAGERATCEAQIVALERAYPRIPKLCATILRAEVIGQAEHFVRFGSFPLDQVAFTLEAIR